VIVDWKLIDKVAFVTVENASANDVALNQINLLLQDKSKSPPAMKGQFFHVQCAAHIINLIVKDGLKSLLTAINKIRETF
jgi:hypothetical protein